MVIVVDVSGSMKGLRITIAKHTIKTILDTLGENDFVNIIAVSTPRCIAKLIHRQGIKTECMQTGTNPDTHSPPLIKASRFILF